MTEGEAPVVSLVVDAYAGPADDALRTRRLRNTVRSLRQQRAPEWELLVAGPDGLDLGDDARVRVVPLAADDPADRLNALLEHATGELVAVADVGAELAPEAVGVLAAHLRRFPEADLLYANEVWSRPGRPSPEVSRKPVWSPERLRSQDYLGRIAALRRTLVAELGGYRPGFEDAHEHDLALRVAETDPQVVRVAEVLYRNPPDTSRTVGPRAGTGHVRAVQEHLDRLGRGATASAGERHRTVHVRRVLPPGTRVTVVIAGRGDFGLAWGERGHHVVRSAASFLAGAGPADLDVVVVHTDKLPAEAARQLRALGAKVRLVRWDGKFDVAKMRNRGALEATGDYLVLADERLVAEGEDFVEQLVAPLVEGTAGVTGPRVLTAGGFHLGSGVAAYAEHAEPVQADRLDGDPGVSEVLAVSRECTAVLADCVALSREDFVRVGGVNETLPIFHTVDLCLKVGHLGRSTVWVQPAVARSFPRADRLDPALAEKSKVAEHHRFRARWFLPDLDRFVPIYGERLVLRNQVLQAEEDRQELREALDADQLDPGTSSSEAERAAKMQLPVKYGRDGKKIPPTHRLVRRTHVLERFL